MFDRLKRPFHASMSDFNAWWTGYSISIPGIAGSLLSILYFGAGMWAVVSAGLRRFPLDFGGRSKWFVFSCIGYALTLLVTSVANDGAEGIVPAMAAGAAFYFVPFLISRYRFSDPLRSFEILCRYAPAGAAMCLIPALYQEAMIRTPAEGATGNASVFGFVAAMLGALSLADGHASGRSRRYLAFGGYLAGMGALLLSETRSLYPAIVVAPAAFVLLSANVPARTRIRISGFFAAAILAVAAGFWGPLEKQFMRTAGEISQIGGDVFSSSLGLRIELWRAAIPAIMESPWLGHGQIHKMDDVISRLPDFASYVSFTHAHNIWIDSALAGGVPLVVFATLVLFSPLKMLELRSSANIDNRVNYIVAITVSISLINGLFNAGFTHDILISIYLIPLILVSSIAIRHVNTDAI